MTAIISPCGRYRYRLEREGAGEGSTAVVMVNPSTADATADDATIRKLRGFGERYAWGRIIVGNLFAFRATHIRDLVAAVDPVGPANDEHLAAILGEADRVVFAWGPLAKQPAHHRNRWRVVEDHALGLRKQPLALGEPCADGQPRHPLMLPYSAAPRPWRPLT